MTEPKNTKAPSKIVAVLFRDQNGAVSSALIFRFVWQLLLIGGWIWQGATKGPGLEWLAFAAGMATGEVAIYNWRRGQDRKLEAAKASSYIVTENIGDPPLKPPPGVE